MLSIKSLKDISKDEIYQFGGKAVSLAMLSNSGLKVPKAICIGTDCYEDFIVSTGLKEKIFFELLRKEFKDMRWEEIWDTSLRIRNLFIKTDLPESILIRLTEILNDHFKNLPTAVRSSAPSEDSKETSFAGLHESYINIIGADKILECIKLVWASLWSDKALLYRKELDLDVEKSTMAVVVQEMVFGEKSGIVFSIDPNDSTNCIVESVYGLNQGLVDGTVEPDRWIIDRKSQKIVSHFQPKRTFCIFAGETGIVEKKLPEELSQKPTLNDIELEQIYTSAIHLEKFFNSPQDIEWTIKENDLYILQSRPITKKSSDSDDERNWYLSLTPSFNTLKKLKDEIENDILPEMDFESDRLSKIDIEILSNDDLKSEIEKRIEILRKWKSIYWNKMIPFAHGMRLFGQIYNNIMKPNNPHEFSELLHSDNIISIKRNKHIQNLAKTIRNNESIKNSIINNKIDWSSEFGLELEKIILEINQDDIEYKQKGSNHSFIIQLLELSEKDETTPKDKYSEALISEFISKFSDSEKNFAKELLEIAKASYRLRDDDNIYFGKIENEVKRVISIAKNKGLEKEFDELLKSAEKLYMNNFSSHTQDIEILDDPNVKIRQVVGQPASPGVGEGKARIIKSNSDIFNFKKDEVLICDAIDPSFTFIVPLASGIVERRGGMLIHGAIIAREYNIPCVTGIPNATQIIRTGNIVNVDGHLGIVTIKRD
ncbi:MAG: PEP/pyruvate-binding domain-containing protein [Armatimonadota bacterium]